MTQDPHETRASLLLRARDASDAVAWNRLYGFYRDLIVAFALRRGCTPQHAEDVLQETMVTLVTALPRFTYDPAKGRFRSYLLRIVSNHIVDAWRRERKMTTVVAGPHGEDILAGVADERTESACAAWDRQWETRVLSEALGRVRSRVQPRTFNVFTRLVMDHRTAAEVAQELGLAENAVHQIRNRVLAMLRHEAAAIQTELEGTN